MKFDLFIEELKNLEIEYLINEEMKNHTTFKIGGTSDVLVFPENKQELKKILVSAKKNGVPIFVLGKGSNLLVSDKGIEGAVISLSKFDGMILDKTEIVCGAGANLSALCIFAKNNSLGGLEFAFGIPGSVGGALFMNAGAYGGEMSQVVVSASGIDLSGNDVEIKKENMDLSYRHSIFKDSDIVITDVTFELAFRNQTEINDKMQELLSKRKEKQPLEYPSAGSTFKRPVGNFAGTLIEKNGFKGVSVGGAQVSEKHAGFIINKGNATCSDVKNLIEKIKDTVYKNDNIMLETEVIFVGRG